MIRSIPVCRTFATFAIVVAAVLWTALPHGARAQQSAGDLRATIESSLLGDPRTAGLSQAQIDAMADILTQEAQKKGMTAYDIMWRPQITQSPIVSAPEEAPTGPCARASILCEFSQAFGFVGPDTIIPFILGSASMGLVWIVAEMLHRRSRRINMRSGI